MRRTPLILTRAPAIDKDGGCVNVIVETPKGSRGKFKYDPDTGAFELHHLLPLGSAFPFDFGFIPSTRGGDGDPLDVLVLLDVPVPVGMLVKSRLIGVIEAEQTESDGTTARNDRLVAVAVHTKEDNAIKNLKELGEQPVNEIIEFFVNYDRQHGKTFRPLERKGPKAALRLLKQSAPAG